MVGSIRGTCSVHPQAHTYPELLRIKFSTQGHSIYFKETSVHLFICFKIETFPWDYYVDIEKQDELVSLSKIIIGTSARELGE